MLKKHLNKSTDPEFTILTDNDISRINLLSFLKDNGLNSICEQVDDYWMIYTERLSLRGTKQLNSGNLRLSLRGTKQPSSGNLRLSLHSVIEPEKSQTIKNHCIVIKSNKMGEGDTELGELLMKGYLNSMTEIDKIPETIIFYNSGVHLCTEISAVNYSLNKLLSKGANILICGACVDFYQLKNKISIGTITNMYTICEILNCCEKVIYP